MESRTIQSFEDLEAWKVAVDLAVEIYEPTRKFPSEEQFGLTAQMRRAGISIPSNIAEGWGRGTRKDYLRFLCMARGSVYELKTQSIIARRLEYMSGDAPMLDLMNSTERLLNGLISAVRKNSR